MNTLLLLRQPKQRYLSIRVMLTLLLLAAVLLGTALAGCKDNAKVAGGGSPATPTVSITSHANGDVLTTAPNIAVSGTLSDDGTIRSLTVLQGGVDVTASVSPTFDQASFSFSLKLAPGNNAVEVQAIDDAANSGSSGPVGLFSLVVTQITGGQNYTCATISTGAARCWGTGIFGRTGYGATLDIGDGTVGQAIIDQGDVVVGATVVQVDASEFQHTCALLDTGAVRCWGSGASGRLGYDNTITIGDNETPATAGDVPVGGTVKQMAVGGNHTCALLDTGAVRCWGVGANGRLGYDATSDVGSGAAPPVVSIIVAGDINVGGTVTQIAAGFAHTCALLNTGNVRCWGSGLAGRLGYNATIDVGDGTPGQSIILQGDINVGGTVTQITAGSSHTCALLSTGNVRCWGQGGNGQLGYGNTAVIGDNETPATAGDVPVGGTVVQIAAGSIHTCALLDTGVMRCWGAGGSGKLGYDNVNTVGTAAIAIIAAGDVPVGSTVTQMGLGFDQTCALLDSGAARCWGAATNGQLGHDATVNIGDGGAGQAIIDQGDVPVF